MKISYKVLQKYIPKIKSVEEVSKDLVMHTAEVEDIVLEGENLEHVFVGEVLTCEKHPNSEKLNCTTVKVCGKTFSIVCGAENVRTGLKVPVAVCGAKLAPDFVIKKTKIRGETSEGMICSEDELGLIDERQAGILELPTDAQIDTCMRDYLDKNDAILEIDNKAINHRPDLFSHIGIIREIYAINNEEFDFQYEANDFSSLPTLGIDNKIPDAVKRYIGLKIENVTNAKTPDYIKQVLNSADVTSKGLLIDITNYSLYLYGQPTHCFDADKINGNIIIRYAEESEKFVALNDTEYKLSKKDIVIADSVKVLALGGIIGGKDSSVTDETTNIIVEGAHFDQATVRKTGKILGIRTDSLNVFEKDIVVEMPSKGVNLIASELEKILDGIKITGYSDVYPNKQEIITIPFDLDFINNLIGKKYTKSVALNILKNLGIKIDNGVLTIPFWRKDLNYKADIAEEIARIDGYDNIESTVPRINLGAVIQTNIYKLKLDARNYFTNKGYYDMYTYSFVNEDLMNKTLGNTKNLVPMKNALSEELTHLRGSLIPNLLSSLEKNIREYSNLKLFELEKIFLREKNDINEFYSLAGIEVKDKDIVFYDIQNTVSDLFKTLGVTNYNFDTCENAPSFAHKGRTAAIIVRGKQIGTVGEIHPKVANNFELKNKIGYFEINIKKLESSLYSITRAKEISSFQENNFDLNFVVDKKTKAKDIKTTITKANNNLITKVELIDIYENDEKLAGKRSLTFKIFIQSMDGTLDDKVKNELISEIVKKVEKKGGSLR
ncbi:MAG: phenylalanine--tRNA ligase subunit beta [Candidatus Gracilibacteria bacterium]